MYRGMAYLSTLIAWARRRPASALLAVLGVVAFAIGIWARLYHLGTPSSQVFDEVYFPVFANDYLTHVNFFDVHPPLGKFIIALGVWVFGNVPFGWRIMPAVFGLGLPVLGGFTWYWWRKERLGALLFAVFLAIETILIVYSRTGLMDGIQTFFILAVFAAAVRIKRPEQVVWVALLLGMACGVKWISLGVIVPVLYVMWRRKLLLPFLLSVPVVLAAYLVVVVVGQALTGSTDPWQGMVLWHQQAWGYQLGLTATHPWSSKWWSWPLMLRPVLFYYQSDDQGRIMMITALGNPILWWSSTAAVVVSLFVVINAWWQAGWRKMLEHPLVPLLLGWSALFLPFIPVHRVMFIYHYLPSYAFAMLMLTDLLGRIWKRSPWPVVLFVAVVLGISIYYLPFAMGLPLSPEGNQQHLWLQSWL